MQVISSDLLKKNSDLSVCFRYTNPNMTTHRCVGNDPVSFRGSIVAHMHYDMGQEASNLHICTFIGMHTDDEGAYRRNDTGSFPTQRCVVMLGFVYLKRTDKSEFA